MSGADSVARGRGRLQLVALAALFFGPLALAFTFYYGLPTLRPVMSTAHGELVSPPLPLPAVTLRDASGASLPADLLSQRWTLVWVGPGSCPAACVAALATTGVVRELLAHDAPRVQRLFLYTGAAPAGDFAGAAPDLRVAALDSPGAEALAQRLEAAGGAQRIYIVDPHGNLMMRYGGGDVRRGLLEDLRRLLKYSHIG